MKFEKKMIKDDGDNFDFQIYYSIKTYAEEINPFCDLPWWCQFYNYATRPGLMKADCQVGLFQISEPIRFLSPTPLVPEHKVFDLSKLTVGSVVIVDWNKGPIWARWTGYLLFEYLRDYARSGK